MPSVGSAGAARRLTVAIPTLNGAGVLEETLAAVRRQRFDVATSLQVLICDSGSEDGSVAIARRHGVEVIEISRGQFSHGGTRNLLMSRARGTHVAFLTQDSVPSSSRWLSNLMEGFSLAADVALSFGPYRPRHDASPMVSRELTAWFDSFSTDRHPRVDSLASSERSLPASELLGRRGFFTSANGCVAKVAWQRVPFQPVPYAEDHVLAHDMLRAGYAKAYIPDAAVVHSHEYSGWGWFKRSFDEGRALKAVYGVAPPLGVRQTSLEVWGLVKADWRWEQARQSDARSAGALIARSLAHHLLRTAGAVVGARAEHLPAAAGRYLSLEARPGADTLRVWH